MESQTFNKPRRAHFRFGVWNVEDIALGYEMSALRRKDESKNYFWAASFICDKIKQSVEGNVTLYFIRRKGMKKSDAVMIQSNWPAAEYLFIDGVKDGKCDM